LRAPGLAARTSPSLPRSFPVSTRTVSPLRIFMPDMSEHLRSQRDDPHELRVAQFPADRAEDAGATGLALVVDEDGGVLVETDVAAVGTTPFLLGPNDDTLDDVALLHGGAGER